MREPGAILLVACYELGHQPLSLAWPAAVLEQRGFHPQCLDVSVEPFDAARAARATLVAIFTPMHTALRLGIGVAQRVRAANPGCHVAFCGLYAGLNAEHLLGGVADSVIAGEIEAPLLALAEALEAAGPGGQLPAIAGVSRRGALVAPALERVALPVPSRGGLPPLPRYVRLAREGRRDVTGHVESTRGCLHLCRHCPIPPVYGGRFVAVPMETVLADVRQQVAAGATHVTFGDPDFLNGPGHARRIARALHAEHPALTFDFTAKIEHLIRHRALLPELVEAGALFAVSAAESLSDTVLAHLDKGHTATDVALALGLARAAGLDLRPTWVAFTPWTTLADYRRMLEFIAEHDLVDRVDPVQYGLRLLVPPGSLLAGHDAMRPHLGPLRAADFAYVWTHPDPRMDRLAADAMTLVSEAAGRGEDVAVIFARVRALAAAADGALVGGAAPEAAGEAVTAGAASVRDPERVRPPHLTEPWFC